MRFLKIRNSFFVAFPKKEISDVFKSTVSSELTQELALHGLSFIDAIANPGEFKKIFDAHSFKTANDRDQHEIFVSICNYHAFYGENAEVIFELNRFNPKRDTIHSIEDLNKYRAGTFSDFGFLSGKEVRLFQLKRYRDPLNVKDFSNFIRKTIAHYSFNLTGMNLLVLLQSSENNSVIPDNFFEDTYKILKELNWKFSEHILVSYLDQDSMFSIVQVYPDLTETTIPFILPSKQT